MLLSAQEALGPRMFLEEQPHNFAESLFSPLVFSCDRLKTAVCLCM